jgi:hypothetical protein
MDIVIPVSFDIRHSDIECSFKGYKLSTSPHALFPPYDHERVFIVIGSYLLYSSLINTI